MENNSLNYNYSAKQQEEIERIRNKYKPENKSLNKMERLRMLDKNVTKKGMITALTIGIISSLIMGVGMCCTMVWTDKMFITGIIIGIIGIIGVISAYPIYISVTKKQREKIAPEILKLTEELSKKCL